MSMSEPTTEDVDQEMEIVVGETAAAEPYTLPVEELTEISDRYQRRQDRVAELESRIKEKDERIAELEDELEDARDLQRLGEAFVDAAQSSGDSGLEAEQQELLEEKNETIAEFRERVDDLEARLEDVQEERDDLEAEVERLRGVEERIEQAEQIEEQLERAREVLGVEVRDSAAAGELEASEEIQDLRAELANAQERIQDLEAENKRLQERAERSEGEPLEPLASYEEFLEDDDVQNVIKEAKQADKSSQRYIKGVIAAVVDEGGWVGYEQIAERLGLKRTNEISSAATLLESYGVVEKEKRSGEMHVDLNVDGLNEIREAAARRRKTEQLMEEL